MLEGHVTGGVIVLDDDAALPEGTRVRVEPLTAAAPLPTLYERFKDIAGKATDLPPDFAKQHDHYIHGSPKQ